MIGAAAPRPPQHSEVSPCVKITPYVTIYARPYSNRLRSFAGCRNFDGMSTQPISGRIPEFTRGDRLRKARELTGLNSTEFAELIGVSQKTVNNAESDRTAKIRKIVVNAWALATGVPAQWLLTGEAPSPDSPNAQEGDINRSSNVRQLSNTRRSGVPPLAVA